MRHAVLVSTILLCGALCAAADVSQMSAAAEQAYSAKQWTQASELFGQLSKTEPMNALWWLRLGDSYRHSGNYDGARQGVGEV